MLQIAWITLRRISEKAVLVQFGILAAVLIYVGLGLDAIILNDAAGSEQSGLAVVWLFIGVFTIFWTTIEIPREMARREVHVYLAKPLTRLQYLLGKFLGMFSMMLGGEIFLLLIFAACLVIKGVHPSSWFIFAAIRTALFIALLNAVCGSVSVLLSEVPAIVLVLVIACIGCVIFTLPVLAWAGFYPFQNGAMVAAYYLLPNVMHYLWEPGPGHFGSYLASLLLYTTGWVALSLLISNALFQRRDLM